MKKTWMILGCAALLITGCGTEAADRYYEDGMKALEKKEYDAAIEDFDQVIAADDRLPEAYRGQGIAWMGKASYPEAIAAFSRSLNYLETEDQAFEKDVMYQLAQARMDYGEVDEAIEVYTRILKKGEDRQAFFLRGKAYIGQDDYENAEKDFTRALSQCQDYNLFINTYHIYVDKNKTVDGNRYLEEALKLEPETGEDYYHRGRIFNYQKNYESAREALIQSMKLGYEDAILLLGRVYLEMEDSASARTMYQEYLAGGGNEAKAYNGLALCDIYEGNYDSALLNIQTGLAADDPEERQGLLFNEIAVYEYKKDFQTAKTKMQAYLEQFPEDETALRENEFLSTR